MHRLGFPARLVGMRQRKVFRGYSAFAFVSSRVLAACAVAVSIACSGAGCTEAPSSPTRLEVVARLLEPSGKRAVHEVRECAIDGEIRPAIGCPGRVRLKKLAETGKFLAAPAGRGKLLLVEKRTRSGPRAKWVATDWRRVKARGPHVVARFGASEGPEKVQGYIMPDVEHAVLTRPIQVSPGMVVRGGFGLDPTVPPKLSAPVEFRISARVGGGSPQALHEQLVSPGEEPSGWVDYRLDLESFAGKSIRLEYATRFAVPARARRIAAPLWSHPIVLVPAGDPGLNFVVVSLDTLRADHVGVYGAGEGVTPVLDALAASGVLFEAATTTFPSTTASHMSLMTGLYPSVHEVLAPPAALDRVVPTLAQLLAPEGYRTAAVTENGMLGARAGFLRGFDSYKEFKDAHPTASSGHIEKVLDSGIAWLERHRNERFFLFLHTYQVHGPHNPPAEFNRFSVADVDPALSMKKQDALYRGEILYTDREMQRLLDALDSLHLAENTVLIVTADHGEAFGERGVFGHGHDLTQELMHIPLLVRAPGIAKQGLRIEGRASLVDIPPTILDLANVPIPPGIQGRTLVGQMAGESDEDVVVYAEVPEKGVPTLAIWEANTKWVFPGPDEPPQVFDVSGGAETQLVEVPPEVLARGEAHRKAFDTKTQLSRAGLATSGAGHADIDDDTKDQLRALGYID